VCDNSLFVDEGQIIVEIEKKEDFRLKIVCLWIKIRNFAAQIKQLYINKVWISHKTSFYQ
jgi:hypothetical protein